MIGKYNGNCNGVGAIFFWYAVWDWEGRRLVDRVYVGMCNPSFVNFAKILSNYF